MSILRTTQHHEVVRDTKIATGGSLSKGDTLRTPTHDALAHCHDDSIQHLLDWAHKNGAKMKKLKEARILIPSDGSEDTWMLKATYRGLQAAEPIKLGEVVADIPEHLALTPSNIDLTSEFGVEYSKPEFQGLGLSRDHELGLFILSERFRENTFWKPYFCTLPSDPGLPISWSDARLKEAETTQKQLSCAKVMYSDNETAIGSQTKTFAPCFTTFQPRNVFFNSSVQSLVLSRRCTPQAVSRSTRVGQI